MKSIWTQDCHPAERKSLPGNTDVNTVVIGAGLAGILTAYFLRKKDIDVIVIDAKSIASGQTQSTTAKITSQQGMLYDNMIRKVGRKRAKSYALANEHAIYMYERIIKEENISCHFEKRPAYLYSVLENKIENLKKEAKAAASLGIHSYFTDKITELPFRVMGGVCFENQAQFHPLEFVKHLADRLNVYENTKVLSVKKNMVFTDKGVIRAKNIVFATHYPFINIPGLYFLRQHQERSYVIALKNQKELSGMYYSIDKNGLSLRSAGDTLLIGGGNHRTGKCQPNSDVGYTFLRRLQKIYYPNATEAGAWSAQDCMPHDDIPFIGKYSIFRPHWYVATGFKKWGMTSSMIAAISISNKICGIPYVYEKTFTPQRFLLRAAIKNLFMDIGESIMGLSKGLFCKKTHRCPHMGCKLEWNPEEKSWDCPCHGSRFSGDGNLIDNPAQIDLNKHL